ncbi:MAG: metal ABC transporter ATP-binding protein [Actinobacteria bacterium]|nr:metal ABC transporter ATP-binding protein [Actinomycetota bacterium]
MDVATGVLQLRGITVSRGGRVALDSVSVAFGPGTSTAMVGPNGSGKTTLLEVLAGLLPPDAGEVLAPASCIALVTQDHHHRWLPLTVAEVVRMGRFGPSPLPRRMTAVDRAAVDDAVGRLEVGGLLQRQVSGLSGGQRQRVLVAQALARRAQLLLLDEPITGLDLASQERILEVVGQETAAGTTVVVTTHNLDEARHCDRVLVLDRRLVAEGTPDEVLTPSVLREAYGDRVLGDHAGHDHAHDLLIVDDHGHGSHG